MCYNIYLHDKLNSSPGGIFEISCAQADWQADRQTDTHKPWDRDTNQKHNPDNKGLQVQSMTIYSSLGYNQGCVRGRHGRGQGQDQGQIISDQGRVRLWNPTRLVKLHRSYVVEEKRQLKVQHRHNRLL